MGLFSKRSYIMERARLLGHCRIVRDKSRVIFQMQLAELRRNRPQFSHG